METVLPIENETLLEIEKLTNLRFEAVCFKADRTRYQCYSVRMFVLEEDRTKTELFLSVGFVPRHTNAMTKDMAERGLVELLSKGKYLFLRDPKISEPSGLVVVDIGLPTFSTVEELRMKFALREE